MRIKDLLILGTAFVAVGSLVFRHFYKKTEGEEKKKEKEGMEGIHISELSTTEGMDKVSNLEDLGTIMNDYYLDNFMRILYTRESIREAIYNASSEIIPLGNIEELSNSEIREDLKKRYPYLKDSGIDLGEVTIQMVGDFRDNKVEILFMIEKILRV